MLCKEEEAIEDFSRNCKFHKRLDSFGLPLEFKVPQKREGVGNHGNNWWGVVSI